MLNHINSGASGAHLHRASSSASNILKTLTNLAVGALAMAEASRVATAVTQSPQAPAPTPASPSVCPALPLPCSCIAAPPPVPTMPIAQDGIPEVFVTTPSPYLDEGVQVIVAQRPAGSNTTSLFALNCIDSLGDNALSSVGCVDTTFGIDQAGLLSPADALDFVLDPQNGVANGANQVLLDYTVILKSIYDRPCTHQNLAQGLAYDLSANNICDVIGENAATFNNTRVVTHFQEALRDALNEPVSVVCYDTSIQ